MADPSQQTGNGFYDLVVFLAEQNNLFFQTSVYAQHIKMMKEQMEVIASAQLSMIDDIYENIENLKNRIKAIIVLYNLHTPTYEKLLKEINDEERSEFKGTYRRLIRKIRIYFDQFNKLESYGIDTQKIEDIKKFLDENKDVKKMLDEISQKLAN